MLSENFIEFDKGRFYYAKTGTGPAVLLIFHGFGQDHNAFTSWFDPLEKNYTIYSFDLFFHGQSSWTSRQPVEKQDLERTMTMFLEKEQINFFEVAGFSLGGKFALACAEAFPDKITRLILLAPDGIKTTFWYSLATYPIIIRRLFKSMVLKPGRFYNLAKFFKTLGLVDKGILKFAESQMDTVEKRKRVYFSWVYFRHLRFELAKLTALLNANGIPLLLVAGKYDKVITVENMIPFVNRVHRKNFQVLESGHNELIRKSIEVLQERI